MQLVSLDAPAAGDQPLKIVANQLCPLPDRDRPDDDCLYVPMPARIELVLDPRGVIERYTVQEPPREELDEAGHFVRSLIQHHQLAPSPSAVEPGVTHVVEHDAKGRRVLTRRGYRAF
jgi:hypothetical protein